MPWQCDNCGTNRNVDVVRSSPAFLLRPMRLCATCLSAYALGKEHGRLEKGIKRSGGGAL